MDVLTVIFVSVCVGLCYGQNMQRKLTRLQLDVDSLRALAVEMKLDIDDLRSWRNATFSSTLEIGVIESDNGCAESQLSESFEQSLDDMEGQVRYMINGLEGEKTALRKMMDDFRAEVRQHMSKMQTSVSTAVNETEFSEEKNETKKALQQVNAKLNQQILATESKDAEIIIQLNRISEDLNNEKVALRNMMDNDKAEVRQDIATIQKTVDIAVKESSNIRALANNREEKHRHMFSDVTSRLDLVESSIGKALEQLKSLSARFDTATNVNGDIWEQVTQPLKETSTTVQDTIVTKKHHTEQYIAMMKQEGWSQYNNSLYKLYTRRANFSNAVKSCEEIGASLVEITDMAELQFITDNLDVNVFWLGATDLRTEGEWRWLSGQLLTDGNWASGEPNNGGTLGPEQGCIVTSRAHQYKYIDYWCSREFEYVCEIH